MSGDGPSKLRPEVEPLDDIILGEDEDETMAAQPRSVAPVAKASALPPPIPEERRSRPAKERSSNRMKAAEPKDATEKKKQKLTLRIPDDEVSRPTLPSSATPAGGIPIVQSLQQSTRESRPPSQPDHEVPIRAPRFHGADDTLELPPDELRARMQAITNEGGLGRTPGIDTSNDPGWTPFQPTVSDDPMPASRPTPPPPPIAPSSPAINGGAAARRSPTVPPISEEIPVETDLGDDPLDEEMTHPHLPLALDSEDIKLDDGERHTDPGDALEEVAPEDLMSVESLPSPGRTAGKHPAFKQAVVLAPQATATSLMAGAPAPTGTPAPATAAVKVSGSQPPPQEAHLTAAAAQNVPAAQPTQPRDVAQQAPSAHPSQPAPHTAHAANLPLMRAPASALLLASVGALAPPPMTDTAAMRKKTRPWWEELFNDDFIRTMAKVTDIQIKGEVDFIEESLGCEAGAMVLDLACGTGRHAVELATRGYQVVGFDLSLAMLARASDEAQERKQKINFVQGDMREMTFEETFDGIYAWNTSFGFFDEEKNGAVIARVHRALKTGGQFLLDVVNRDYIVRQAPSLAWFEGDGCICMDEMTIDFITSRMKVKRTLMLDDGRTKEIEYSIRIYALHELGKMLHDNGFRVAEVSGRTGTPGVFFGCESPRTLILAEKR